MLTVICPIYNEEKIYIIPDTFCTYLARETFSGLAKNNFGNCKWNILTVYYTKQMKSLSLRHFIPLLFVPGLIVPAIVGIFWHPAWWLSSFVLLVYLLALGTVSTKLAVQKHLNFFYLYGASSPSIAVMAGDR